MRKHASKYFIIALAVAVSVLSACVLVGCSSGTDISLTHSELTLRVGEVRNITPYVVFYPPISKSRDITLVSDSDCVSVDGTRVTAVEVGSSTVTVACNGATAELRVTVEYRAPYSLDIETDGETVQTIETEPRSILFAAKSSDGISPDTVFDWSVDGASVGSGETFEFTPDGIGEYTVAAEISGTGLRAEKVVRVYLESAAYGYYSGVLDQGGDYSKVVFSVRESADSRNPRSVYEWRVNGERRASDAVFEFVPPNAGEYEISLIVNGVPRKVGGADAVTVTAQAFAPSGHVEFDGERVYVAWNVGEAQSVSITAPSGTRKVFERSDIRYSYLFGSGRFDATDYIEVFSSNPAAYTVRIDADARGAEFEFLQYPISARAHAEEKVFAYNSFITSAEVAARFADDLYAAGRLRGECYLARGVSFESVKTAIETASTLLGLDATVTERSGDGCVAVVEYAEYSCVPTEATRVRTEQLHTVPHFETDKNGLRASDYVFAPSFNTVTLAVETGEQLLRAVTGGFRPVPAENSSASEIYRRACDVLMNIIGADYDAERKVHAIYDWLQISTGKAGAYAEGSEYSFLECVFGGVGTNPCASYTSAGAAKAFALMCGIEGIECSVIAQSDEGGIYCFNRVKLDGRYYYTDVYGGEGTVNGAVACELNAHSRLLMSDATAKGFGLRPNGEDAFDDGLSFCRAKSRYDGFYTDRYIDERETTYEEVRAATFAAFSALSRASSITVYCAGFTVTYPNDTFCAEFELDAEIEENLQNAVIDVIVRYTADYFREEDGATVETTHISVFRMENTVIVAVPVFALRT